VKVWKNDGTLLRTLRGHKGNVNSVITLTTGELASGGDDCTVKIWDPINGSCK